MTCVSLKQAKADLAALEAEIAAKQAEADKLRALIELAPKYGLLDETKLQELSAPDDLELVAGLSKDSPFYGLNLGAAAALVLAQAKTPLTTSIIGRKLKEAGWNFVSDKPSQTIYWALREYDRKTGEVHTIPGSQWVHTSWQPEDEQHAKARAGLEAARTRGTQLGPPRKVTVEMIAKMCEMRVAGATKTAIARAMGVSIPTVGRYCQRSSRRNDVEDVAVSNGNELGPNVHRLAR